MKLAFLHVYKTGGVSVERAVCASFPDLKVCPVYQRPEFLGKTYADLIGFDFYQGHFDIDFLKSIPADFKKAVVVRHPLDQTLSLYNHIGSRAKHMLHKQVAEDGKSYAELFSVNNGLQNLTTKALLGKSRYYRLCLGKGKRSDRIEQAVAEIRENMKLFDAIGVTPRLNKFVRDLGKTLGGKIQKPGVENTNKTITLEKSAMTEADMEAYKRTTWVDRAVFKMLSQEFLATEKSEKTDARSTGSTSGAVGLSE